MKNRENENFGGFSVDLCRSGTASLRTNDAVYTVVPGCLIVNMLNRPAELLSRSGDYSQESVSVSLDMLLDFPSPVDIDIINMAIRHPVSELDEAMTSRLLDYYALLGKQDISRTDIYGKEIFRSLLYALMLEICDLFRSMRDSRADMPKPRQETLTDDFFRLLAQYYRQHHTVGFYADRLNRTPKYLSGAIRKLSGRSVSEWIALNLVREARSLLKTTDRTVLEISEDLNFSSPSVFIQFFRQHTGVTPLKYRRHG